MRIAQVAPFLPERPGGSAVYSSNLALQLEKRGHRVDFYAPNFPANGHREFLGDRVRLHTSRCYGLVLGVNPLTLLTRQLAHSDADVLHAHSYIYTTSNQAALVSRITDKPFVLHIHGATYSRPEEMDRRTSAALLLKERIYDPTVGRWTIDSADAIAAVSRFDLEQCRRVFGVSNEKLHIVPNAVDPSVFCPPTDREAGPPVVTFMGRLEPWKGALSFLEIARAVRREVPEASFRVVGTGSLRDTMQESAKDLGESVQFFGEVPHEMIPPVLQSTSVMVLPSFMEGLPTVCLEALACGVPVVASDTGGTSEVVVNDRTGYLEPVNELSALADHVVRLLRDPDLRERLGRNGRDLIQREYSWGHVAALAEDLYRRLV